MKLELGKSPAGGTFPAPALTVHKPARRALFSFIVTFVLSWIYMFLIMSDKTPNIYHAGHKKAPLATEERVVASLIWPRTVGYG